MTDGTYGSYGGQYVPEVLMPALDELTDAYHRYVIDNEAGFREELQDRLETFGGRPTPLQRADNLSDRYDRDVYLKREDLLHGGAHKLNNALGQVLLAKYMGKERVIAETGAGQHGTATAMAAAHLDMPCEIFMGERDINRQRPNVYRMRLNDATVTPVSAGKGTLKEAINATLRDWATSVETTHYVVGSVVGPHPFPALVNEFQSIISTELRHQFHDVTDGFPDAVIACAGGGSNAMGSFEAFREHPGVALHAVEAGGSSLTVDDEAGVAPNSASLSTGSDGVLHGAHTKLLQDHHGQIVESHSISAGLDYAAVGPELANLVEQNRVQATAIADETALEAFHRLAKLEGIIPALESAHALGYLETVAGPGGEPVSESIGERIVVTLSGRGDKDLETVLEASTERDLDVAPTFDVFSGDLT